MGIIISEADKINIIDFIDRNYFLKSLFPLGVNSVFIGQFGLDQAHFSLNIHVYEKPACEVEKWGRWGVNYNCTVIHLLGTGVGKIKIENWDNFGPAPLACWIEDGKIFISCNASQYVFEISCFDLIFQGCSTYLLGE